MARQLLLYENATAVSAERHKDWSLAPIENYHFARHINAMPLVLADFGRVLSDYLIVFVESGDSVQPVAITGVKPGENLYVDDNGRWNADYIPGFVRRYPFVFAKHPDDDRFALCLDESHQGWNSEGRGERLFDEQGERTAYLKGVLDFSENYQRQFELTQAFCRKLLSMDLLEPASARVALPGGVSAALRGFKAVSREKLKSLPGSALIDLMLSEAMELIYIHLLSLRTPGPLVRRLSSAPQGAGEKNKAATHAGSKAQVKQPPAKKAPAKAKQKTAARKAPAKTAAKKKPKAPPKSK